jgi:hypothetical protein
MPTRTTADRERRNALLDELGEDSFPASDPPAVWTWDVAPHGGRVPRSGAEAVEDRR